MTDTDTQAKRDLELEFYRERLTELANSDDSMLNVLRNRSWYKTWAENTLRTGEALTGPGVDLTSEEREAAVKLLED